MTTTSTPPRMYSVEETAEILGISRTTLYDRILRPGLLPTHKIGARRVLIKASDIEDYLATYAA